jgi:hypothetical protein
MSKRMLLSAATLVVAVAAAVGIRFTADAAPAVADPRPRATVECGSYSNPNNGCTEEREDAIAAYTTALAWSITGNAASRPPSAAAP